MDAVEVFPSVHILLFSLLLFSCLIVYTLATFCLEDSRTKSSTLLHGMTDGNLRKNMETLKS